MIEKLLKEMKIKTHNRGNKKPVPFHVFISTLTFDISFFYDRSDVIRCCSVAVMTNTRRHHKS